MRIAACIAFLVAVLAVAQGASSSSVVIRDFGIYQIRVDGSGRTALLHDSNIRDVADISPDRTHILFYPSNDSAGLYSAAIDGSAARLVVPNIENRSLGPAAWSPGGKRIAIEVSDLSPCKPPATNCAVGEVWLAKSDGTSLHRLVRHAIAPAWSPDSRRVAYIGSFEAYGETGVVTVGNSTGRLDARELGPTEYGGWRDWQLTWSPRGDLFGYTTVRRVGEPRGRERVAIVRVNGPPRLSVRTLRRGIFLSWSPNGKRLLYLEGKSHRIIVARPDGQQRRFLTTGYGPVRWSPNGRWIAFVDETQRYCYQLFLIRPDGRDRHQLTDEPCTPRFKIFWSRDSKWLIYPVTTYPYP